MKILFVVENYYPHMGGVSVVTKYLAEGLVRKKYEVHVATRWFEGYSTLDEYNEVKIHRFQVRYNYLKECTGKLDEYREFVLKYGFDAIIFECAQCATTDSILPYLNQYSGIKIFHSHGFSGLVMKPFLKKSTIRNTIANTVNYYIWKRYYNNWLKKYIPEFDEVFCLSEIDSSKQYLDTYSVNTVKILSNAAEDIFFDYKGNDNPLKNYLDLEEMYFISIANYAEDKNQIGILREFYRFNNDKYMMVFIGSTINSYYKKLMQFKQKYDYRYGKKKVFCLTEVKREDIPGIIKNAELYLTGSKMEAFSISLIESMAMGVPFISTNVGNARILPGGITIDNITKMHKAIESILADKKSYSDYSKKGIEYARSTCRISNAVNRVEDSLKRKIYKD